ncbi:MAG TPA: DNA polymerase III subunit delta [Bacteroidales bacterium]|nr:DNA polymerase III subunit delta [Lentimicrobiaceae bacterium]HOH99392.1 DNA polymerase III subunit delta [Bacteroidales bacterium]
MRFADVIGQDEAKMRLILAAHAGRISHAQLFFGPEGSGALSLALAYAQFLNCQHPVRSLVQGVDIPTDACGQCPSCVKYAKLAHPDLHFIFPVAATKDVPKDPVSKRFYDKWRPWVIRTNGYGNLNDWYAEIGIEKKQGLINSEDCSEILRVLSYKSYEGGYKVMMIWMVEKLFHAAAPKILKVLEEPPEQTLFLLITEDPTQLINTIRSRTQLIKMNSIADQDMLQALKRVNNDPAVKWGEVIRMAQGNYREALRLLQEKDPDSGMFEQFKQWMRYCFQRNVQGIQELGQEFAGLGREEQKQLLFYALNIVRESMLLGIRGEALSRLTEAELEFAVKFGPFVAPPRGMFVVSELEKALGHVERNANASILFTGLSLGISRILKQPVA